MSLDFSSSATEASKFLTSLALGNPNEKFSFQTFDDSGGNDKALTRVLHGTIQQHISELKKLNVAGAGIFVTVNKTDLKGRAEKNIVYTRAYFVDSDDGPIRDVSLKPTMIVNSVAGDHIYWVVNSCDDPWSFKPMQKTLSNYFKTDPKVCDPPRVMRLPGFYHLKNRDEPRFVKVEQLNEVTYSLEKIFFHFSELPEEAE